jgi:ATP-dependent DNA ligase
VQGYATMAQRRAAASTAIFDRVPSPAFIQLCSPTTVSKPPTGERWTNEVKWDGFRCFCLSPPS